MAIDIHCHVVGNGRDFDNLDDVYFNPYDNKKDLNLVGMWALYKSIQAMLIAKGADIDSNLDISADEYLDFVYKRLSEAEELNGIVLLAMDAVYGSDGKPDIQKTDLRVPNKFLFERIQNLNKRLKADGINNKRFYFGASVNPNRKDWKEEFLYVINETDAVLLKWIPSAQHIEVDQVPEEFYKTMAQSGLPLLCHVGPEYSFVEGTYPAGKNFDDFEHLKKPLECGVKVIAAHCALPVFPTDKNRFDEFLGFLKTYNKDGKTVIWTDTSALCLSTRLHLLKKVRKSVPMEWLLHGSDFPIFVDSGAFLPLLVEHLSFKDYRNICATENPFDRDIGIKRAFGFDDSVLENAIVQKVLRIN